METTAKVPFRKSEGFRRFKLRLKRLIGREPRFSLDQAPPLQHRGEWCLDIDSLKLGDRVYSLGVGRDTEFDLSLIADRGVEVHAFDPTPGCDEWLAKQDMPGSFNFHPWAVAAESGEMTFYPRPLRNPDAPRMYTLVAEAADGADSKAAVVVPAYTLSECMRRLGHEEIAVLKMDIEGAEYDVLNGLFESGIRPRQVLVEFHHRFESFDKQQTIDAVERFRELNYRLADISSTGREFTFLS